MKVIKSKRKKPNFIAGIFANTLDAEEYFKLIPEDLANGFVMISLPINYPFYIIEQKNDFKFVEGIEKVIKKISHIKHTDDYDKVYFNFYTIKSDYSNNKPEQDNMGCLSHTHIDNYFLERYKNNLVLN